MAYYHAEGLLYTGSYDKTVKVWRVSDKKCVDSFVAHEDSVNALLVNQDDGCVFTCSVDGSVKIWRRVYRENSHTLTMTLKFQQSPVNALALSSYFNNCFLYSGSSDGTINFWEKEKFSGRFNHGGFLQGHRFAVLCLVAIEKLLFSGSEDTTIRVWRREEGSYFHECLAVLDGHRGPVRCLAACLEMEKVVMGFLVYSASLDQTFKVWRVKVLPEEKRYLDYREVSDSRSKVMEYEMSPVLSPSWVKKKLKGDYFQ
jgi:WD40 repeat protein